MAKSFLTIDEIRAMCPSLHKLIYTCWTNDPDAWGLIRHKLARTEPFFGLLEEDHEIIVSLAQLCKIVLRYAYDADHSDILFYYEVNMETGGIIYRLICMCNTCTDVSMKHERSKHTSVV